MDAVPNWRSRADWSYIVDSFKCLYSAGGEGLTGHVEGCYCERHGGFLLPQERYQSAKLAKCTTFDIQQYSTDYYTANQVAKTITSIVGKQKTFIDLGAGNGVLSALLLLRGHVGVGVEIDHNCMLDKIQSLDVETPFSTRIGYRAIFDSIDNVETDEQFGFVVMHPPSNVQLLKKFLDKAFKFSNVVFAIIPTEYIPTGKEKTKISAYLDKKKKTIYPLQNCEIPLRSPKYSKWGSQAGYLDMQLCAILKKTKGWTTLEELIESEEMEEDESGLYPCTTRADEDLIEGRPKHGTFILPSFAGQMKPSGVFVGDFVQAQRLENNGSRSHGRAWKYLPTPCIQVSEMRILETKGECRHTDGACHHPDRHVYEIEYGDLITIRIDGVEPVFTKAVIPDVSRFSSQVRRAQLDAGQPPRKLFMTSSSHAVYDKVGTAHSLGCAGTCTVQHPCAQRYVRASVVKALTKSTDDEEVEDDSGAEEPNLGTAEYVNMGIHFSALPILPKRKAATVSVR